MLSIVRVRCWLCFVGIVLTGVCGCKPSPLPEQSVSGASDGAAAKTDSAQPATSADPDAAPSGAVAATTPAQPAAPSPAATPMPPSTASAAPATVPAAPLTVPASPSTTPPAQAEITLGIGDPAPPLAISRWVMGEPLDGLQPGQVHVVEFWATWCGPCLAGMPHISQLQTEWGDKVHFVGVTREEDEVVDKFLEKQQSPGKTWKEVISYRIAMDQDSATNTAYMRAAGQNGIPCAFIVGRDGVVEWIGHPMRIDEPLAKVVEGTWDRAEAIAQFKKDQQAKEFSAKLVGLLRAKQWDDALAAIQQFEDESEPTATTSRMRMAVLKGAGRTEEFNALQAKLVEQVWDDAAQLNQIAWGIALLRGERDLPLALKAAQRGVELTEQKDAAILDTLARVHYESGDLDQAIAWQQKAVDRGDARGELAATLKKYQDEQAAKTSAAESAPPADAQPAAEPAPVGTP
jgi:thiol-disulfide isomerase/thioredoxin